MLIDQMTEFCHNEYQNKEHCGICGYELTCPERDCGKCLEYVHFPQNAPNPRIYDCRNMANYYVCKYSHKYMSEIVHSLSYISGGINRKCLKVLSLGCGPCTDLFAFDFLKEKQFFSFKSLDYVGVELSQSLWGGIHTQIKNCALREYSLDYRYQDALDFIKYAISTTWDSDIVIFQYVLSDMQKHMKEEDLGEFITQIQYYFNNILSNGSFMLFNDINLAVSYGGGRDHFDTILRGLEKATFEKIHFRNNNKSSWYSYGNVWPSNDLVCSIPKRLNVYSPYTSCSSAQLIIKKVK